MFGKAIGISLAVALVSAWSASAGAQVENEQERKRIELLKQLGLEKRRESPPPPRQAIETNEPAPAASLRDDATEDAPKDAKAEVPGFVGNVHRLLVNGCQACHSESGIAGKTGFIVAGDLRLDHQSALKFVDGSNATHSSLVNKAAGLTHAGGVVYASTSAQYKVLIRWIGAGAHFSGVQPRVIVPPQRRRAAVKAPLLRPAIVPAQTVETPPAPVDQPESQTPTAVNTYYAPRIHELIVQACGTCHSASGIAGGTRLILSNDSQSDFYNVVRFVDYSNAKQSPLLVKALGNAHGGGQVVAETSEVYARVLEWIEGGAMGPAAPLPVASSDKPWGDRGSAPGNAHGGHASAAPGERPSGMAPVPGSRIVYPGGLRLNGRFDLNYERRGMGGAAPGDSRNAIANYHRFVFLTRETADDPFGFTAELLTLQMWQAHMRIAPETVPLKLWFKVGKLLVPFGTEPLFHQYYGGHGGFDQRVMPTVWAREGAAVHVFHRRHDLSLTWDLYAVRGYELRSQDTVLNLQNDFSDNDPVTIGYGQRVGAAWGPLSAYYSSYVNNIGFDRLLFLQALDFTVAQWHGIPVLERLTAGFGLLRADISGGGSGQDYFHLASYFRVRYFLLPFVWLQYRQGLRTINNRRNLIGDDTRWGVEDGSTHNFALWARYRGVSGGISYFLNFEKADEVDDDFFRLTVVYDF
ncbi:MAG: hypothetical protein SGI86_13425 [Deltaproteobacteria bacterium]|nr:hypothetical protein [Deltaproteobacteria bacterium]